MKSHSDDPIDHRQASPLLGLTTEQVNPNSVAIDSLSALEIVRLMNAEDAGVARAVATQAESIGVAIDSIAARLRKGGRLIYLGAGTSGRLGVLDASECPPTFSTPPELVVGLIAGGPDALTRSIESVEDRPDAGAEDLKAVHLTTGDVVVGIATSGRTPYVLGGLRWARSAGVYTIGLSCNADAELASVADLQITPVVGPEVISGSTRLKAGTATKMVLNMLTTGVMVLLGKTYGNLMVDVGARNSKLATRARAIVERVTCLAPEEGERLLNRCGGEVKTAIVAHRRSISPAAARRLLAGVDGQLRAALADPLRRGEVP